MISNTQANMLMPLLNAGSNPALPLITGSQAQAPSAMRFDLTLLQMTSRIQAEGVALEEGAVSAPVKAAFESVLQDFSQMPKEELQSLAGNAVQKEQIVSEAAEQFALEPKETRVLKALVELASRRLAEPVSLEISSPNGNDTGNRTPSVLHSGPKGGTTESSPEGQKITKPLNIAPEVETAATAPAPRKARAFETEGSLPEIAALGQAAVQPIASQAPQVPVLVSTRTSGVGSGEGNEVTPLASTNLRQEAPLRRDAPALELTVSGNAGESQPKAKAPVAAMPQQNTNEARPLPQAAQARTFEAVLTKAEKPAAQQPQQAPAQKQGGKAALPVTPIDIETDQVTPFELGKNRAPEARTTQAAAVRMPQGSVEAQPAAPSLQVQAQGQAPLPEIEAGTEIQVSQTVRRDSSSPEPARQNGTAPSRPEAAIQQALPALQPQAAALPQRASASAEPAPAGQQQQEEGGTETLAAAPAMDRGSAPQSMRFTGMRRWLAETVSRFQDAQPVQNQAFQGEAPMKSVAEAVTREFAVRESVFQQAMEAISQASQDTSRLRIKLRPESLGELDVVLSVEAGKVTARLVTSTTEVRDVFAGNLQQFKSELEARGLVVSQLSVAVRAETQSQGQPQQQPQPQAWTPQGGPKPQNEAPLLASVWSTLAGGSSQANLTRFSALA